MSCKCNPNKPVIRLLDRLTHYNIIVPTATGTGKYQTYERSQKEQLCQQPLATQDQHLFESIATFVLHICEATVPKNLFLPSTLEHVRVSSFGTGL